MISNFLLDKTCHDNLVILKTNILVRLIKKKSIPLNSISDKNVIFHSTHLPFQKKIINMYHIYFIESNNSLK